MEAGHSIGTDHSGVGHNDGVGHYEGAGHSGGGVYRWTGQWRQGIVVEAGHSESGAWYIGEGGA